MLKNWSETFSVVEPTNTALDNRPIYTVRNVIFKELHTHSYQLRGEIGLDTANKLDGYAKLDELKEPKDEI